jgi:hypothetical protein
MLSLCVGIMWINLEGQSLDHRSENNKKILIIKIILFIPDIKR